MPSATIAIAQASGAPERSSMPSDPTEDPLVREALAVFEARVARVVANPKRAAPPDRA